MLRLELSVNQSARKSEIFLGRGLLDDLGQHLSRAFTKPPKRVGIISNKRVFNLYGRGVARSLKRAGFQPFTWLMPEGERYKAFPILEKAVKFLNENRFERNDLVVALGGGVVGDLAGFAAAIYLRGIPVVQVPTTLLAQIDSSVGGKTGINLATGKNLVGSFHQPAAVFIDTETLMSLPPRELVSGSCEMVKHAFISGSELVNRTVHSLRQVAQTREAVLNTDFAELIAANCAFKASIVSDDERESTMRSDSRSRRILNFGHTTAHALETVTGYRVFRHGEAVGYGMLVAGELSRNLGLLDSGELESLREAVALCGPLPRADKLDLNEIIRVLKHDKKSVDGQIKWVLLEGMGRPKIVNGGLISPRVLRSSLRAGLQRRTKQTESGH